MVLVTVYDFRSMWVNANINLFHTDCIVRKSMYFSRIRKISLPSEVGLTVRGIFWPPCV